MEGRYTLDNTVKECTLNKSRAECANTDCSKCGWNEKEIARRKERINTKGLIRVNSRKSKVPIYGIKVNKGRKKQSDK